MFENDPFSTDFDAVDYDSLNVHSELYDTNGDGYPNVVEITTDLDSDGYHETKITAFDTNHSGEYDTYIIKQDMSHDGNYDTIHKEHDYNQDGVIDSETSYHDLDNDGKFELVTKSHDSNGDGFLDKTEVYIDTTGTGQVDYHESYDLDPTTGMLTPTLNDNFEISGTYYAELDHFKPDENYPEGISGDPAQSMTYWEYQGDTNRCALYSQKFVIEELTNTKINVEEFANIAKENGWFTEEGGTKLLNMNNMLEYYGVENEMTFHNSVMDIENCLSNNGKVIVSLDSHEIWYGENNNIFSPDNASNHAVEVIGIDRSDPNCPMVILNDSGNPYGKGEMIPLDVFEGAWEDGDCQMIKCYPSES